MYSNLQPYVIDRKPPPGALRNPYLEINRGIVGDWLLNGGSGGQVFDLSGNRKTGTITGATWGAGKYGSAIEYSETAGHKIDCGKPIIVSRCSVVVGFTVTDHDVYHGLYVGLNGRGWSGRTYIQTNGKIGTQIYVSTVQKIVVSDAAISAGVHHQHVFTYDLVDLKCYVDGLYSNKTNAPGTHDTSTYTLRIGEAWANGYPYEGLIDYLYIYNRDFTASEIAQLYREPFCGFRWTNIVQLASYVAVAGVPIFRRRRAG